MRILIIYTGGTIGMIQDPNSNELKPFDFEQVKKNIPELTNFDFQLDVAAFENPIDSSDIQPHHWIKLAEIIEEKYIYYDGFVILHGSDTMAYTASALSFMLENLNKPIIITGSQIPIGNIRTDAKEHIITAIEIAATKEKGKAKVPEVCIYFDYLLLRGNRARKHHAQKFEAFKSPNYPPLAEAGTQINFNSYAISKNTKKPLKTHKKLDNSIGTLKLFPGISAIFIENLLKESKIKALVIETFGAGNASTEKWFLAILEKLISRNILVVDITQCAGGMVYLGKYETSTALKKMGVISGKDLTFEACITKLMFLYGNFNSNVKIIKLLQKSLRGELTE